MTGVSETFHRHLIYMRLGFLLLLLVGVYFAAVHRKAIVRSIRAYFNEVSHPVNLAVFRIASFGALLYLGATTKPLWFAQLPHELLYPIPYWSWVLEQFPPTPGPVAAAHAIFMVVCVAGLIGYHSRFAAAAAFFLGVYVLGIPQFYGKINHYHHALWFVALIAGSPADDALSVRSKKQTNPGPAREYAMPLRFAWLLMGVIYFFPGLAKLWTAGPAWISGEAPRGFVAEQSSSGIDWLQAVAEAQPTFYAIGGFGTVLFELSFVGLILFRRTRLIAAIGGVVFHFSTWLLMGIAFLSLQVMYLTFLDWNLVLSRFRSRIHRPSIPKRAHRPRSSPAIGILFVVGSISFGALKIDTWPIAVYPQFAGLPDQVEYVAPFSCGPWPKRHSQQMRLRFLIRRIQAAPLSEREIKEAALRRVCDAPPLAEVGGPPL